MGYLLKETLKTLCGVNHWAYAVFWKIGCQNPKLLIWEECYYEDPELTSKEGQASWASVEAQSYCLGNEAGNQVHLLVTKMMTDNYINLLGEGLIGRAAFTGNHQWILSDRYTREGYLPEVSNEVCLQFSAGMQTIAVIPVLPHGVVQLCSSLSIMENIRFVNEVKTVVFQLGCIPGALLETCQRNEPAVESASIFSADFPEISKVTALSIADSLNHQCLNASRSSVKSFEDCSQIEVIPVMEQTLPFRSQLQNGVTKAKVIPLDVFVNRVPKFYILQSKDDQRPDFTSLSTDNDSLRSIRQEILSGAIVKDHLNDTTTSIVPMMSQGANELQNGVVGGHLKFISSPHSGADEKFMRRELTANKEKLESELFQAVTTPLVSPDDQMSLREHRPCFLDDSQKHDNGYLAPEETCVKPPSGDDLFDVVGVDFKNKLFDESWNNLLNFGSETNPQNVDRNNCAVPKLQGLGSDLLAHSEGESKSGIFSVTPTDHLLDAVVSGVRSSSKQTSDDDVSCRTTLTKVSTSSASIACGGADWFNPKHRELVGFPKSLEKPGALQSGSFKSGFCNQDGGKYSETNSIYAPQISSWLEQGNDMKQTSGFSTAYSKKPDEINKSNRKRIKPGENPRPRPKDRQMIQDRVKELREIIPNGAKCSIDALLERTIKHMLFLQSVTHHADKLKQTGDSKIINNEGRLLLKDNFEGGATWAYQVGSQSMVCPIIVEDLNSPRQMLVEMICEERGFFLEIADIIRVLGLTILKGVMETLNDNIWARFTVEANKDVTRMEVFLSLVRLLEQTVSSVSAAGCIDNGNMIVHQSFQQAASIPVTGRPL